MERSNEINVKTAPETKGRSHTARLTGAAWVDKPVKVDGMTTAEEFTNKADSTAEK